MPHSKRRVQLLNNGMVSYACQLCDKAYPSEYGMKLHLNTSHPNREIKEGADFFACPFCGEKFRTRFQSRNNRRVVHNNM